MKEIVILGAGISGLSLAWYLKKNYGDQAAITILEKSPRVGGWIQTIEKGGFLFELGPRGCRPSGSGAETLRLIQELDLQDQLIVNAAQAKIRYLYRDKTLVPLPSSVWELLSSPWLCRLVGKPLFTEWSIPKMEAEDETIYDFFSRRFGARFASSLVDPMVLGIYAGDIHQLSIRSCFPKIYEWEQTHGSVLRGVRKELKDNKELKKKVDPYIAEVQKASLFSLKGGMEVLVHELALQLQAKGVKIQLETAVQSFTFSPDQVVCHTGRGPLEADQVYSTLPPHQLASILPGSSLGQIPMASLIVVNLGYASKVLRKPGFGYLIPSSEKEPLLGVVWDSSVFPQQNSQSEQTRLTVMLAEKQLSDHQIYQLVLESMAKHLDIHQIPNQVVISRQTQAIPHYPVGHTKRIAEFEKQLHPRLKVLGTAFRGVAVNDCIASAKSLAQC